MAKVLTVKLHKIEKNDVETLNCYLLIYNRRRCSRRASYDS